LLLAAHTTTNHDFCFFSSEHDDYGNLFPDFSAKALNLKRKYLEDNRKEGFCIYI
jgi:hypothetical protein